MRGQWELTDAQWEYLAQVFIRPPPKPSENRTFRKAIRNGRRGVIWSVLPYQGRPAGQYQSFCALCPYSACHKRHETGGLISADTSSTSRNQALVQAEAGGSVFETGSSLLSHK